MAEIMRARGDQAPALAALHALCFERPWPASDFETHVKRDIVLTDREVRALLILRDSGDQAEILTLATHPDHRGSGLARQLMAAGEAALSARVCFLEVAEDNSAAIALYQSLGYQPFGRRPHYYRRANSRVAALLFEKKLPPSTSAG